MAAFAPLKIVSVKDLHVGAGWRDFSFLRLETDTGIVGYSEFLEERNIGVTNVILWLGNLCLGENPLQYEKLTRRLRAITCHISGGIAAQAVAAVENALLDIVGKHLKVPVCALWGGPLRTQLPVYWSHAGSFRLQHAHHMGFPRSDIKAVRALADVEEVGREVLNSGHTALKTNIFLLDNPSGPCMYMPGFDGAFPELNLPFGLVDNLINQLEALRRGCGPSVGIKLDLNFNFKPEGIIQIGRALVEARERIGPIDWLEYDILDPVAMRKIKDEVKIPIASLESCYGRNQFRPYFEARAVDYCIVDVLWNGAWESLKIAALAESHYINCATHNYHGWLGTAISAHFCAAIPNFKVLEIDVDDVAWKDEIVTFVPEVRDGMLSLPMGPGWGVDLDETAMAKYPATRSPTSGIWSGVAAGATQVSDEIKAVAEAGQDATEWEMQTSDGWILVPFTPPSQDVSAGKKCTFEFEGTQARVTFKSAMDAVVAHKGREYPARVKA